eukprot:GFUD01035054.1.p1 GENE.GFUD01035054.1~~GFUD01035054.1.p1  ORF type:complete len:188 (-),score=62.32 GFUD01035054.1:142-705(-)
MPSQRSNKDSNESMASRWAQLRQYEDQVGDRVVEGTVDREMDEVIVNVTAMTRLQQIKESSSRTFANLKNQVSGIYRKSRTKNTASTTSDCSDVNSSPHGDDPSQQNGCGPLQSIGMLGARLKSSKSLQNLEIATKDSLKQVVDRTTNMGENMKHKYGSRMDMSRGRYDKFKDDPDSDEENSGPGGL